MTPLSCEEARALADARLDGALPALDGAALRAHLEACARCAAAAAEGRRLHAALLGLGGPDPGPAFTDRVIGALDRSPGAGPAVTAPASPGSRLLRGALALAGTSAVAAAALLLLPVEEAAAAVGARLPVLAAPVPDLPAPAVSLLAGIGEAIPPWAAVLAAVAAFLGALLPGRRSAGRGGAR